ncbi:hypothetical protein JVT61DRAFT_1009 [Boletus reticuloceps]|uniref:Uncharacterized protein n=1 Tax=Boletus reticuloceps TaxID=495285 RepID=A0A8I2YQ65_9AGAM|nr:hypothetical protein JVT61DRAFT_1009 [Boletus reticuloceps]
MVNEPSLGIFAYTISLMNGVGGRKGWQWISILEGTLTVALSLVAYFVVPTWSYKAKFLTEEERCHLIEKLQADSDAGTDQSFQWSSVRSAFEDHLVWAYSFLFHGFSFVQYSFSFFLVDGNPQCCCGFLGVRNGLGVQPSEHTCAVYHRCRK